MTTTVEPIAGTPATRQGMYWVLDQALKEAQTVASVLGDRWTFDAVAFIRGRSDGNRTAEGIEVLR